MALRVDRGQVLHPVEVELLCEFAEVRAPFPIEVPASGLTHEERLAVFAGARESLTDRELADEDGPLGVADDFVYLLRSATGVLDLVVARQSITRTAAVLVYRDEALLVTQDRTDPDRMIWMRALSLDDAVEELVRMVAPMEASRAAPFSVPRRAVERTFHVMLERMPEPPEVPDIADTEATVELPVPVPMTAQEVDELLREQGVDDRGARRMVSHLQPVLGSGQVGVAVRDGTEDQWHRVGSELCWLDTERGRLRLAQDGDWISVNSLTRDEFRARLRALAAMVRG